MLLVAFHITAKEKHHHQNRKSECKSHTGGMKYTEKDDLKFYLKNPDPNFSPQRNKFVVESTIKKHDALIKKKKDMLKDPYMERADAVVTYLKTIERGGVDSKLERFFSKKYLAFLRGDDIRKELMSRMTFMTNDGKIIKPNF